MQLKYTTIINSILFWVIMSHSLEMARSFGATYHLHLLVRRVSQTRNQQKGLRVNTSKGNGTLVELQPINMNRKDCFCLIHENLPSIPS
jgi:hypothetical protein